MRTFAHPNKTATEPIELFKQVLNNENYYFPLDLKNINSQSCRNAHKGELSGSYRID